MCRVFPGLVKKIKLYFGLIRDRNWWAINYRLQFLLRQIDLNNMGVDELGLSAERSHEYADSGGLELENVLDSFNITPLDAIIDFGCGKGGALITLAKYPFVKIIGVELSTKLVEIAKRNLRKLRIDNVSIQCCDAIEFKELDDYNFFYFFSPFPCPVMKLVIGNIETSLNRKPRKVTIIYLNPECHEVVGLVAIPSG